MTKRYTLSCNAHGVWLLRDEVRDEVLERLPHDAPHEEHALMAEECDRLNAKMQRRDDMSDAERAARLSARGLADYADYRAWLER